MSKKQKFELVVPSILRDKDDNYYMEFNNDGWFIKHIVINGQCDVKGEPYLYRNFTQDSLSYPYNLGDQFEFIWHSYDQKLITSEEVEARFLQITKWLRAVNENRPSDFDKYPIY